jgi:peptide deformylase
MQMSQKWSSARFLISIKEIDHLSGILFIDRALLRSLMTEEVFRNLWKDKSIKEVLVALG